MNEEPESNDEQRPDPEKLLKAIKNEEQRSKKGRLKIFLGMAAGVGKTYAMLENAQRLHKLGINVVVGTVNTHGREETAQLLEGLIIIPEKWIKYKDTVFEEMDIDEILRLKPQIVIIDELAHSNVPGSRHPKRWQDVLEILDNGIDVYATLNVQHIESLNDVVENIAGVTVRETVPDQIIEAATNIELVDITPDELLQRLKEGKVYLGEQSQIAAQHFFQEDRLTALRELVMRYAAEKVDHDLHEMVSTVERGTGWTPRERLLVAVSRTSHSQKLIRTTRRLAYTLDAPWMAVHIDDGRHMSDKEKATLAKNLALARDLGAEVITTNDSNIAKAIERIARQRGVTQIIIGRPPMDGIWDFFNRYTLLDQLAAKCGDIDIHVIRQRTAERSFSINWEGLSFPKLGMSYFLVSIFVLLLTLFNSVAVTYVGYKVVGFIFLLGILFLSIFFRKGPVFFAALLYALIWKFFFVPSVGEVATNEDDALLALYLFTGVFVGLLTDRGRQNREMLLKREETAQALYEIARDIASSPSSKQIIKSVKNKLDSILEGKCEVILKMMDNGLYFDETETLIKDEKERAAANWVFENDKEAGWSTSTLPATKNLYLPLKGFHEVVGVLTYHPTEGKALTIEEKNFLYTVGHLLANHIERSFSEERQRRLEHLNQIEKVYQSILNLLSNQFQTPINTIRDAVKQLKTEEVFKETRMGSKSIFRIENSSEGLIRVIENISAMAKLSSGLIPIKKQKHDVKELLHVCEENVKKHITVHKLSIVIQEDLPLVYFDFSLIEILVCNLIFNAIENSPPNSTINVEAKQWDHHLVIAVSDEGKGIPEEMLEAVFEKFYRLPGTTSVGLGLGLSIAKTIAEIHGGKLKAENRPTGGSRFSLFLPIIIYEEENNV